NGWSLSERSSILLRCTGLQSGKGSECGLHTVLVGPPLNARARCEASDYPRSQGAGKHTHLIDVSGEVARDATQFGDSGRPHRGNRIRHVLGDEYAIHVEFSETESEDASGMMPGAVVIGQRG